MTKDEILESREGDIEPQLPTNLHPAIRAIVEPYPADRRSAMAIVSLPFLGMLGGDARFLYRNQEVHHLGFESCLVGEQGIGKSVLTRLQRVLISQVEEQDSITRRKMDEYADTCIACGESGRKPVDPHYGVRIMMPDTTKAQFYQNIKNLRGKRAIIVASEIDSLGHYGNWCNDRGACERLMFDTETGGQDTKSHGGTSASVPLAVNMVTSCTPVAMYNHYRNTEDGLVTRVAFCSFPADVDEEAEESARTPGNIAILNDIQQRLLAETGNELIDIPALRDRMLEWCKRQRVVSDASGNRSVGTFRKRAAVMGFRAGCILYLLDCHTVTEKALEFAEWVSEYVLYYQMKYFGNRMNESIETNAEILQAPVFCRNSSTWVFNELPENFSYLLVGESLGRLGMKATGYRTVVSRWIRNGWVEAVGKGQFRKTGKGNAYPVFCSVT